MSKRVTMYSTSWCGYCRRLQRQLDEAGIDYEYVDLDRHGEFDDRIVAKTGGYRVVPTLEIGGELLVNPSLGQVRAAVHAGS